MVTLAVVDPPETVPPVEMVYSASVAMPDNPKFARYAHTFFLTRHALSLGVATFAAFLAFQIPMATWEKYAPWLFVFSLVLLILVLIINMLSGLIAKRITAKGK